MSLSALNRAPIPTFADAEYYTSNIHLALEFLCSVALTILALVAMKGIFKNSVSFIIKCGIGAMPFLAYMVGTEILSRTIASPEKHVLALTEKPEPTPPPAPSVPAESSSFPWDMVIASGVALVVLAVLMFISIPVVKSTGKKRNIRTENLNGWNNLMETHDSIRTQIASYELDIMKIIDLPLMNDMREKTTQAVQVALVKANHLRPSNAKKMSSVESSGSPYATAVHNLEVAFATSQQEAQRVRWSKFTADERKNLQKAKDLLNIAMDTASSESERQVAYKRAIKELEGIVVVPEKAMLALEERTQLALTV